MSHREIRPHLALQQNVRCFWTQEDTQADYNSKEIFPDPFVELIINCGAPLVWEFEDGSTLEMPSIFLNNLQTKPLRMKAMGPVQVVSVRLYPWAVSPFVGRPLTFGTPSVTVLDSKIWRDLATTIKRTVHLHGYEQAIDLLQDFMRGIYCREQAEINPIRSAGNLLFESQGQVRMSELAARCYLSPSQFERRFKQLTTVSPKTYARIIRFRAICEHLIHNPSHHIISLAQDYGFTDQAHLTHDFRAFAEQTPTEFAAYVRATPEHWRDAEFLQYI